MQKYTTIFLYLQIFVFAQLSAQKSTILTYENRDFQMAQNLYRDHQYSSAKTQFENIKSATKNSEIQSDCAYYIASCAIKSDQNNSDILMENFISNYPTSIRTNTAAFEVASFYFDQNNFEKALEWFEKVDETNFTTSQKDQVDFQKGYAFFANKNTKQAIIQFNKVENSVVFGAQAKYYLGYIAYDTNNFSEANKQFEQVSDGRQFKEKMSYYQADMNFRLGKFAKAIELGQKALEKSNAAEQSELHKIIGESHFNLKQFDKAIPFLEQYQGKKGKWSNTDYYILGYSFYKNNNFEKAISQFNKIIDGKDFVAQNAYYHLGESYLKVNKKPEALNAFKNASEIDFDQKITEDAALNYARLSYDVGNSYQSVPQVLNSFLEKHPKSNGKSEIETLLISSYITSKNYQEALILLEKNKNSANKIAYQKVTFYRGLEFFSEKKYNDAAVMFKKSIAENVDTIFMSRATFWTAETYFNLERFDESLVFYKKFYSGSPSKSTTEFQNIAYNLGYNYFKLKQYQESAIFFEEYISQNKSDKSRLNDSYIRLGDCNFVLTKYNLAIKSYDKAIDSESVDADYASFQTAICYGFLAKNDRKIENLNAFLIQFSKSEYRDDTLFELANTYVATNNNELAISTYIKLYNEFPQGIYAPKAILKHGLVLYNTDKDAQALVQFKKVTTDFPGSAEALEAVATARLIYVDSGKINDYADWVKTLNFVKVTDVELDNDSYESAEKQYQDNKPKQAIEGFEAYNARFREGIHSLKSNFYLSELYVSDNQETKSISGYEFVVSKPKNEFTERALVRLSEIYIKLKNTNGAISILKKLELLADLSQNISFAQANLMKLFYETNDFENAEKYADEVLLNPKNTDNVKNDAQIIVARSAIKTNSEAKAKTAYAALQKTAKGELASEALFYDAYFKNKENLFEQSNVVIQKLSKNYGSYKYFAAKSLVVMAKNFYGLKDSFQANFILESVIKNFSQFADIIADAKSEQSKILSEEGKTNSSIQK
ncbi:MAG: hypothetical protein RLZZ312_1717 [Bacteroidota bacterium]